MTREEKISRYITALLAMCEEPIAERDLLDIQAMATRIIDGKVDPIPWLYPAERGADGRLRWDRVGGWVDLSRFPLFSW